MRRKTVATSPGKPTAHVPLSAAEEAARDAEEAAQAAIVPPSEGDQADAEVTSSPALTALVRLFARRFNSTEQQVRDDLKAELSGAG